MIPKKKVLLSVNETAEYLGISVRTIYNHTYPGAEKPFPIKHYRIGKLLKFDLNDINKWLDSQKSK